MKKKTRTPTDPGLADKPSQYLDLKEAGKGTLRFLIDIEGRRSAIEEPDDEKPTMEGFADGKPDPEKLRKAEEKSAQRERYDKLEIPARRAFVKEGMEPLENLLADVERERNRLEKAIVSAKEIFRDKINKALGTELENLEHRFLYQIPAYNEMIESLKTLVVYPTGIFMLDKGVRCIRPNFDPKNVLGIISRCEVVLEELAKLERKYSEYYPEGK